MGTSTHQYFKDPAITRLMGLVVALAGEVFVLKAKNERLTKTLLKEGALDANAIERAGRDPEFLEWMAGEKDEFASALLRPLLDPDIAQKLHDELFHSANDSAPGPAGARHHA
jgi:hypothetical protein